MAEVMMALGDYRFSVDTAAYGSQKRSTGYRWAKQEVIGAHPRYQFIGQGEDTQSLSGVILTTYQGGLGQLDDMRAEAGLGEPLQLIDGVGWVYGLWCITKISETKTVFFADGAPRKVEFSLDIVRYSEEE